MNAPGQRNRRPAQIGIALISVVMAGWLCLNPVPPVPGNVPTVADSNVDAPTVPPGDPPPPPADPPRDPITAFWLTTPRIKPGPDGDEAVVLLPHLSQRLEDGSTLTRLSWRVEPAFDAVFGFATSSTAAAAVVGDRGDDTDLEPQYWDNGDRQAQDEEQPLAYWNTVWPKPQILRIPSAAVAGADACYRLHATLTYRDAHGALHQWENEQLVRFLPFSGQECTLPAGMLDPTGILPPEPAETVLRSWLGIDDWYVECVAVIRLKALGRTLASTDLAHFFRLAALVGNRPLVARALDALDAGEGAAGAGQLLAVGCDWALPWAIRFGTPGTTDWLRAHLENLLSDHPGGIDRDNQLFHQGNGLVSQYLTLGGPDALAVLEHLADRTRDAGVFDLLLKAIGDATPAAALDLARRHHPGANFQSTESVERLMRSDRSEDVIAACQGLAGFSQNYPQVQPTLQPLPDAALAPLLRMTTDSEDRDRRLAALSVLACARDPRATAACLAALSDEYIGRKVAQALVDARRTDVAPAVFAIAKSLKNPHQNLAALWPLMLSAPPDGFHAFAVAAYLDQEDFGSGALLHAYLMDHAEAPATAALQALADQPETYLAVGLLADLGDTRGVPLLLDRWSRWRASAGGGAATGAVPATADDGFHGFPLSPDEIEYLATVVTAEQVTADAHCFLDYAPSGMTYLDRGGEWLAKSLTMPAPDTRARIRNYCQAVRDCNAGRDCTAGGPGPLPVPSPVTILRLRALSPAVLQPLTVSTDTALRALGATLLAGIPLNNPTSDDAAVPILEHLLSDPDEQVRVQAFCGLESHCAVKAWCWQPLMDGRPAGPARTLVSERIRSRGAGRWSPDGVDLVPVCGEMIGWLAAGDHLGLPAVTLASTDQTALLAKALAAPAMTGQLAYEILEQMTQRTDGNGYAFLAAALQQPLDQRIRGDVIEHLAPFAEERRGDSRTGRPPRPAEPGAIQVIMTALQGQDPGLRYCALQALTVAHVPASLPVLEGMLAQVAPQDSAEPARAILFQGPDEGWIAPLENLLRAHFARDQDSSSELEAYVAAAGTRALPLLRELEARARTRDQDFSYQEDISLITDLIRLQDPDTVADQADWYVKNEDRWRYDPDHLVIGDALRREIRARLLDRIAHAYTERAVETCLPLARVDSDAAVSTLIRDFCSDDASLARRAQSVLGDLLGNANGGETLQDDQGRGVHAKAQAAARWWQIEQGRSVEQLSAEGLLP
jgi:hypothetical protein